MADKKRLIDANALMETLERYVNPMPGESGRGYLSGLSTAMDEIEAAPTVDAVPVVHGRCDWCNGDYHTKIMATAIRYHSNGNMDVYEMKVNYCPNCGADMRERSEGE